MAWRILMAGLLAAAAPAMASTARAEPGGKVDDGGRQALAEIANVRGRIAPIGVQRAAFDRFAGVAATIEAVREGAAPPEPVTPARGFEGATPPEGRLPTRRETHRANPLYDELAAAEADLWTTLDARQRGILSGEWGRTVAPLTER